MRGAGIEENANPLIPINQMRARLSVRISSDAGIVGKWSRSGKRWEFALFPERRVFIADIMQCDQKMAGKRQLPGSG